MEGSVSEIDERGNRRDQAHSDPSEEGKLLLEKLRVEIKIKDLEQACKEISED
jgi:hypothetical protein